MKCFSNETLPRPGGSGSRDRVAVTCGLCPACLSNKRNEWTFRITEELRASDSAQFIGLSYDDEHLTYASNDLPTLNKNDPKAFLKVLRQKYYRSVGKPTLQQDNRFKPLKIRYYAIGEYGSRTARPHYHFLLFNLPETHISLLQESWPHGHVHTGKVEAASIHYCTGYIINNELECNKREKPFAIMSKRPGIGAAYLETNTRFHKINQTFEVTNQDGITQPIPKYYRDKIFNSYEKEISRIKKQEESIRTDEKKAEEIKLRGDDPQFYDFLEKEDLIRQFDNLKKKNKLL